MSTKCVLLCEVDNKQQAQEGNWRYESLSRTHTHTYRRREGEEANIRSYLMNDVCGRCCCCCCYKWKRYSSISSLLAFFFFHFDLMRCLSWCDEEKMKNRRSEDGEGDYIINYNLFFRQLLMCLTGIADETLKRKSNCTFLFCTKQFLAIFLLSCSHMNNSVFVFFITYASILIISNHTLHFKLAYSLKISHFAHT